MIAPADPIVRPAVVLPDMPPGDTTSRKAGADGGWSSARVLHVRSVTRVTNGCQ
jgi:hypothetical protein